MSTSIAYGQLSPMLIVFGAAVVGILVEAFAPRKARASAHAVLAVAAVVAAFIALLLTDHRSPAAAVGGSVAVDGLAAAIQGILLVSALPALALMLRRDADLTHTEVVPLTMFALGGMMAFASAQDLLTLFVALEVFSLPLYLMCALAARRRRLSQEAALKYFLLGAFSSAVLLFGVALWFGGTGSVSLTDHVVREPMGTAAAALIGVGLLFKVGAVPFHSWVPDVYQGAPTPVTAFMAAATKVAAFGALLRVTMVGLEALDWRPVIAVVAVLTLAVGSVAAVTQTDVKRLLAYSAIAHSGFLLVGVFAGTSRGIESVCFYLVVYSLSTIGAFAIASVVRDSRGEVGDLDRWAGLGRRSPWLAAAMALFLLAFAGIPLTSGFAAKFGVFAAAAEHGGVWLVVIGVVASAVAAVFYIRVVVTMYFSPEPEFAPDRPDVGRWAGFAIVLGAASVVVLGLYPQPLIDLFSGLSLVGR
ncbi:NADH-quinone oxidoreductase subunit NuoN [Tsukamurella sp. 8F]|uniref:NADH-quinone oxidoreductase subunit NuoN n=1 Tax=unclassified Tsukamurella TaxID=2633480 RepID=UPI0023B998D4|nr:MULTISPECIES: NADH-quinone oxidoreductase subunit NuoN [unclassified Tsukamurella]MDF0530231.1 NADH-quinone oxidoreductase subunit NuoN [Tsukamurella sp. 8J]MDF0586548.1 NADH-quinone oxidoreductase subunit NuoN [Tsukamurella sp. 8F]